MNRISQSSQKKKMVNNLKKEIYQDLKVMMRKLIIINSNIPTKMIWLRKVNMKLLNHVQQGSGESTKSTLDHSWFTNTNKGSWKTELTLTTFCRSTMISLKNLSFLNMMKET